MLFSSCLGATLALVLLAAQPASEPEVRVFHFTYAGVINQLEPGQKARVWLPMAPNTHVQKVELQKISVPGQYEQTKERAHRNCLLYFEAEADDKGEIPFSVEYLVRRKELIASQAQETSPSEAAKFLKPEALVPNDKTLLAAVGLEQKPTGSALVVAKQLYDAVDDRMRYDKPAGERWGRGDARWACDSGFGNCTDFHSVFIALCRICGIPAQFEIGFPIPKEKGQGEVAGYHCWAKFAATGRWIPIDISEADRFPAMKSYYFGNLTADRVTFTVGRDLQLSPAQDAGPVNFLIYPYVEVDGKPHDSFEKRFTYKDVPQ